MENLPFERGGEWAEIELSQDRQELPAWGDRRDSRSVGPQAAKSFVRTEYIQQQSEQERH